MSPQFGGLPGMPFFPQLQPMNMFHQQPPANFLSMLAPNFGQLPQSAFSQGLMQQTATQQQLQQHALVKSEPTSQEGKNKLKAQLTPRTRGLGKLNTQGNRLSPF